MATVSPRGRRLLKRYPVLAPVPEHERAAIVGAALRNPVVLLLIVGGALLLLPPYFHFAFDFLRIGEELNVIFTLAKLGAVLLLPLCIVVPLLSRFLLPVFILREMKKRGYSPQK